MTNYFNFLPYLETFCDYSKEISSNKSEIAKNNVEMLLVRTASFIDNFWVKKQYYAVMLRTSWVSQILKALENCLVCTFYNRKQCASLREES